MSIKFSILIIFLAATGLVAFSTIEPKIDNQREESTGIIFFKGTWAEAIEKAKSEKKQIFLDLYATWCGPCKSMKRKSFTDAEVGKYFNENYVNVELDAEIGDGLMLARTYKLTAYPSLYIIDTSGIVVRHAVGYHTPQQLLSFGKDK